MATPSNRRAGERTAGQRPMAPDAGNPVPYLTRQPSRWPRNTVLLAVLAGGAVLTWTWTSLRQQAVVGSAYAASAGCVCRFVSQRPLESCEAALGAAPLGRMARLVSLSEDEGSRTLHAGVPLLASQSATFRRDTGCVAERWAD